MHPTPSHQPPAVFSFLLVRHAGMLFSEIKVYHQRCGISDSSNISNKVFLNPGHGRSNSRQIIHKTLDVNIPVVYILVARTFIHTIQILNFLTVNF